MYFIGLDCGQILEEVEKKEVEEVEVEEVEVEVAEKAKLKMEESPEMSVCPWGFILNIPRMSSLSNLALAGTSILRVLESTRGWAVKAVLARVHFLPSKLARIRRT